MFQHLVHSLKYNAMTLFGIELGRHIGVMLEENVVKAAGTSNCTTEEELRRIIRDAGFKPVQRDTLYRTMFLN